jgi:hypothetical protein
MQSGALAGSAAKDTLAIALVLWSFGSCFAIGAVGTGLALLPYD